LLLLRFAPRLDRFRLGSGSTLLFFCLLPVWIDPAAV
jgi:hypothetical protein